jgi:hypothetical protein
MVAAASTGSFPNQGWFLSRDIPQRVRRRGLRTPCSRKGISAVEVVQEIEAVGAHGVRRVGGVMLLRCCDG